MRVLKISCSVEKGVQEPQTGQRQRAGHRAIMGCPGEAEGSWAGAAEREEIQTGSSPACVGD